MPAVLSLRAEASVPISNPASVRVARLSKAAPGGLDSGLPVPILWGMVRKRATFRELDVSLFARNRALDYLANSHKHRLSDDLRYQLTQVVEGYAGRCDEAAARAGIEWMRGRYRDDGKTPRF